MAKNEKERISHAIVSGIVTNEKGEVLVQDHVKKDGLVFPGGKIDLENDEEIHAALARELKEELDIDIIKCGMVSWYITSGDYPAGSDNIITWAAFVLQVLEYKGVPKNMEPDKCRELMWMSENALRNHDRSKEHYYDIDQKIIFPKETYTYENGVWVVSK